jgi:hypothetical protein
MILMLECKFAIGQTVVIKTETDEFTPWQITSLEVMPDYRVVYWAETAAFPPRAFYDFQLQPWEERYNEIE